VATGPLLRSHVTTEEPKTTHEEAGLASISQTSSPGAGTSTSPPNQILEPARPRVSEQDSSLGKRRKTIGGLTVRRGSRNETPDDSSASSRTASSTARQLQTKSREFPQRKKKNDYGVHQLQPSSVEKFIAGVWKQIYSNVELAPISLVNPTPKNLHKYV
jgi:hypothetical protein